MGIPVVDEENDRRKSLLFERSIVSRGLPSSFIYIVLAAGQDPGRTEQIGSSISKFPLGGTGGFNDHSAAIPSSETQSTLRFALGDKDQWSFRGSPLFWNSIQFRYSGATRCSSMVMQLSTGQTSLQRLQPTHSSSFTV